MATRSSSQRGDSATPQKRRKAKHSMTLTHYPGELWGLSSMTLRKGKIAFSFGRANRFQHRRVETTDIVGVLPSTLNPRSTSFGYGARWTPINPTGKDSPSPNRYDIAPAFEARTGTGYSFGSRSGRRTHLDSPGPGSYEVNVPLGKHAPKFSIRAKFYTNRESVSPPPDTYRPNTSFVQVARYKNIGFGFGDRTVTMNKGKVHTAVKDFPGPGTYHNDSVRVTPLRTRSKPRQRPGLHLASPAELLATLSP